MHFEILGRERRHTCSVEVVMADVIRISRKPSQVFTFRNVSNFVDAMIGHSSVVAHVGRDGHAQEEAQKAGIDTDKWRAFYWEKPAESSGGYGYTGGESILPPGSLAQLEMENKFELEWELEVRQTNARKWIDRFKGVQGFCQKISHMDRANKFADADNFQYMNIEELDQVLIDVEAEYEALTHKPAVEIQ